MNLAVVVVRCHRLGILNMMLVLMLSILILKASAASGDSYELNNAVIGDVVRTMENKNTVQEVILTDDQILEMYPNLNLTLTKKPPVSIMSGKIPDHLIKKMADYIFGLLQGTGEVIKPTTTTTTPSTTTSTSSATSTSTASPLAGAPAEFLPFRSNDLAVIRDAPKTADFPNFLTQIRRKPIRKMSGVSRKKSEKLWRKTRMVKTLGRA
ncbi:hypothetical protein B9Z55_018340 [Caenorhabditis nigoni]|uniref:Uncharacterized protein n=1 Tax=Caenorhabditis nigoni TaxID=1611254 RepID=A0A2G5TDR6_9PELO|nr:hypothetical protein B9Z55_018340 [Caenorhabditis nigoni]